MNVVAFFNIKGGVGKTTAAIHLAHLCARRGARTLLFDLDPQGSATYMLRAEAKAKSLKKLILGRSALEPLIRRTRYPQLDIIPASLANRRIDNLLQGRDRKGRLMQRWLRPLEGRYRWVILDCPPTLGRLAENILLAADLIAVPVIPAPLAERAVDIVSEFRDDKFPKGAPIAPFLSLVDRRRSLHRAWLDQPKVEGTMRSFIPYASVFEQASVRREPVTAFAPDSEPAWRVEQLMEELEEYFADA